MYRNLIFIPLLSLLLPTVCEAQDDGAALIKSCDLVAASSFDPARPDDVPGMTPDELDAALARAPCEAALQAFPDNPRLQFEVARVYAKLGEDQKARALYELSAKQGYAVAEINLSAFYHSGRGGLARDDAEAVKL